MKVLGVHEGALSNWEVLRALEESRPKPKPRPPVQPNPNEKPSDDRFHEFVNRRTTGYLIRHANGITKLSEESIQQFFIVADGHHLSSFERLQIMNRCPQTLVELWLLLENPEDRFSEEEASNLLGEIKNVLYLPETNPEFVPLIQRMTQRRPRVPSSPRASVSGIDSVPASPVQEVLPTTDAMSVDTPVPAPAESTSS